MREQNIGVLAVQETHLTNKLADQFNTLFGNRLTLLHSPDPTTRNARGIAIILNKKIVNTSDLKPTKIVPGRAILVSIPWQDNQRLQILAIYSQNIPKEVRTFWKTINNTINGNPSLAPNIMLGDFNLVEDAIDRLPSKADDAQTVETLRNFKNKHNLIDGWRKANPEEKGYSWARESDGTQSRLDRIYVNEEFFNDCKDWEINPAPIPTDHDIVSAKISTPSTPVIGKGRWAIPTRIFKNKKLKREIQELAIKLEDNIANIHTRTTRQNPQTLLKDFKLKIIKTTRNFKRKTQPIITTKIQKISETLHKTRNNPSIPVDKIRIITAKLKKDIQCLLKESHHYNRDKLSLGADPHLPRVSIVITL